MKRIDPAVAAGCLLSVQFLAPSADAAAIDRAAWLAGCWRGGTSERIVDEQWMAPRAGLMLGMARTATVDKVAGHEQMRIAEAGDRLVFTAKPAGKPEDSFVASAGDDALVFENLEHPFPQRIMYRRLPDGSLHARIEGKRGEREVGIDYPMKRVGCGEGR